MIVRLRKKQSYVKLTLTVFVSAHGLEGTAHDGGESMAARADYLGSTEDWARHHRARQEADSSARMRRRYHLLALAHIQIFQPRQNHQPFKYMHLSGDDLKLDGDRHRF